MNTVKVSQAAREAAAIKLALRLAAHERMLARGYYRQSSEPTIHRQHVDGPCFTSLDGQTIWLSVWERLLTKLGIWDAWDIEWRRFPLPTAIRSKSHD